MKTSNTIKSFLFLFAILFSFSVNAYNSLNQLSESHIASLKKLHVDRLPGTAYTDNSIIFEELENESDNEDFSSEAFLLLPFFFNTSNTFNFTSLAQPAHPVKENTEPIFISIRVLRI